MQVATGEYPLSQARLEHSQLEALEQHWTGLVPHPSVAVITTGTANTTAERSFSAFARMRRRIATPRLRWKGNPEDDPRL